MKAVSRPLGLYGTLLWSGAGISRRKEPFNLKRRNGLRRRLRLRRAQRAIKRLGGALKKVVLANARRLPWRGDGIARALDRLASSSATASILRARKVPVRCGSAVRLRRLLSSAVMTLGRTF